MGQSRNKTIRGFTLVELLIVVAIVGLLSTLVVIAVGGSRTKSYDTRRLADVNDIQKALVLYSSDYESYPPGNGIVLGDVNNRCLSIYGFTPICPVSGERVYLATVPASPQDIPQPYIYTRSASGASYTLEFELVTTISDLVAGYHIITPQGIQ